MRPIPEQGVEYARGPASAGIEFTERHGLELYRGSRRLMVQITRPSVLNRTTPSAHQERRWQIPPGAIARFSFSATY
jgi:hypothetical protein